MASACPEFRTRSPSACGGRFIRRTRACNLNSPARTMRKSGVPSVHDAPRAANTSATRPAIGARRMNAFPDAVPPPLAYFFPLSEARPGSGHARVGHRHGAARVFDTPARDGAPSSSRSARPGPPSRHRLPSVLPPRRIQETLCRHAARETWLEPAEQLSRCNSIADRWQLL